MADYKMNSMRETGKENMGKVRSKLAINLIVPPTSGLEHQQHPADLPLLHEEYEIMESAGSTRRDKKGDIALTEGRMKLRDYLFLAKTSALKNA